MPVPAEQENKPKILFITAPLFDYLADSLLIGLREIYGANCVDYPRKPIMYGDLPSVYGRGFTIWSRPIPDVRRDKKAFKNIDLVIYSNYRRQKPIDWRLLVRCGNKAPRVVYLDGNDDTYVEPGVRPFFKRELVEAQEGVFPIGFCIPERLVRPLDISQKTQLHQTHVQDPEFTDDPSYKFTDEKDYYDDLSRSFFGITMRKGGWDCMRHYELLAAGTLLMFKDFDRKPALCAPQCPAFINYRDKADFVRIAGSLVQNGKPGEEYVRALEAQRNWLLDNATCTARARKLMTDIEKYFEGKAFEAMPVIRFRLFPTVKMKLFLLVGNFCLLAFTLLRKSSWIDWFYHHVFKKLPGARWLISFVLRTSNEEAPARQA
jgi:hypothetical protein